MSEQKVEAHHPFGPSTLGRLDNCPPSYHLAKDEPELESEDAKEGTMLHGRTRQLIDHDPRFSQGLTEEQRDACERCYDFMDEVCPNAFYYLERRVSLRDDQGEINWGTLDFIGVSGKKVVVIDWKFGRKIKEESLVLQVSSYAAAAVQSMSELRSAAHLPVEAWVFFPRLGTRLCWRAATGEEAIHTVAPSVRQVRRIAENANGMAATPGNWCDYCPHLPNCEAVRQVAEKEIIPATSDDLVDPTRAIELYDLSLVVEKQAKAYRAMVRDLLISHPDAIPGLQLRNRNSKRSVADDAKMKERMIGPDKLSIVEYMRACSPTVVALEGAYVEKYYEGRKKGLPTKEYLKKRFAEVAGDLVKTSKSKVLTRV